MNVKKTTTPETRVVMTCAESQPTMGAWFQAKLNRIKDEVPAMAPTYVPIY